MPIGAYYPRTSQPRNRSELPTFPSSPQQCRLVPNEARARRRTYCGATQSCLAIFSQHSTKKSRPQKTNPRRKTIPTPVCLRLGLRLRPSWNAAKLKKMIQFLHSQLALQMGRMMTMTLRVTLAGRDGPTMNQQKDWKISWLRGRPVTILAASQCFPRRAWREHQA